MTAPFHIVLVHPQIHWNTGAIGRTCVALGAELILIHPLGFNIDEKEVKRAGLDYWPHVKLIECENWEAFLKKYDPAIEQLHFFSTKTEKLYYDAEYKQGDYLIFGSETAGLPEFYHNTYADQFVTLPQYSQHVRSLNLANTATAASYEALRQIRFRVIS